MCKIKIKAGKFRFFKYKIKTLKNHKKHNGELVSSSDSKSSAINDAT